MTKPKPKKPARPKRKSPKAKPENTDHLDTSALDTSLPLKNARHERFCHLLSQGMSQTQAYILAGYAASEETARRAASVLMTKYDVASRSAHLLAQAAAMAIDVSAMTKADVLNEIWEQHQRNTARRPVRKSILLTGMKEPIEIDMLAYNEHAASQTLKLLSDEYGLGEGGSASRGVEVNDIDSRAAADSPHIIEEIEGLKAARRLVLAGGKDVEREASKVAIGAALKKLAGEK